MAKKQVVSAAIMVMASQVLAVEGEVVARTAAGVTVRNKKPKSPKMRDTFIPNADLVAIYTGEDSVTVAYRAVAEYDTVIGSGGELNDFGMIEVETENGTVEINPAVASVGSVEVDGDGDEKPAKAGKKPAAKEEEEEKPAKGGKKPAAKEPEADEYEPEEGDRVAITNADEEVFKGVITAMTAKTVTITDKEDDEHKFKWDDISIEKIKGAAAKKPAAKEEEDEKPAAKKPAGKKPAADAEDW